MNAIISAKDNRAIISFNQGEIDLIKSTICKGASDTELKLFLYQCSKAGLDPLAKQAYAVKRWDASQGKEVMAIQTGIDGFRLIAERTEKYAGQEGPEWCGEDGVWHDVWLSDKPPIAARCGVIRKDFSKTLWAVAKYNSYVQRKKDGSVTKFWQTMPELMLGKVAEALALRRAFPQELSGIYSSDEMAQTTNEAHAAEIIPEAIPAPEPPPAPKMSPDQWAEQAIERIQGCKTLDELTDWETRFEKHVVALKDKSPELHRKIISEVQDAQFRLA